MIIREEKNVQRVNRDRVTSAPSLRTKDELQHLVRPMTIDEPTPSAYRAHEQPNTCGLHAAASLPASNGFRSVTRLQSKAKQQDQAANTKSLLIPAPPPKATEAGSPQEYFFDQLISHKINDDQDHPSAKLGDLTYRDQ